MPKAVSLKSLIKYAPPTKKERENTTTHPIDIQKSNKRIS